MLRRVLEPGELWEGEMCPVRVGRARLVVLRTASGVRAYEDRCAHLGVALSGGTLRGTKLICPAHHYEYDALTGEGTNPRGIRLCSVVVECREDGIWVEDGASRPPERQAPESGREPAECRARQVGGGSSE